MKKQLFYIIFTLVLIQTKTSAQRATSLFNGKNLDGWYIYLNPKAGSQDPDSAFVVQNNMLYITGLSVGYICTKKSYKNFHLTLEFKWGEKKYPPRLSELRDSGILYGFASDKPDKIWPRTYECQIQEGDCGDFWLADSLSLKVGDKVMSKGRIIKTANNEKPHGEWNKVEIIALNGKCTHIVNGVVVNEGTDANVREGKIALQTEAAEMYYRNIRLEAL